MNKSELNQPSMPKLIIIRGPLGVGKTTVSKMLADKIGAFYISIDQVLEDNNLDNKLESEECISVEKFVEANRIAIPEILNKLINGQSVIVDGNFYHKEAIENMLDNVGDFESQVFTLKSSLQKCIERDSKREKVYGAGAATAVHNLVSRFDYGINIDVENLTQEKSVEAIEKFL